MDVGGGPGGYYLHFITVQSLLAAVTELYEEFLGKPSPANIFYTPTRPDLNSEVLSNMIKSFQKSSQKHKLILGLSRSSLDNLDCIC